MNCIVIHVSSIFEFGAVFHDCLFRMCLRDCVYVMSLIEKVNPFTQSICMVTLNQLQLLSTQIRTPHL